MAAASPVAVGVEQLGEGLPGKKRDDLKGSLFPLHEVDSTQGQAREGQGIAAAMGRHRQRAQRSGFGLGKI
jgi:hypothetical protein